MNALFLKGRCLDGRAWFRTTGSLGLALLGMILVSGAELGPTGPTADLRSARLQAFFNAYGCPGQLHIEDYLRAADTYGIDYRLLPAVSVRESTCGRYQRKNNHWGWDSAKVGFVSVAKGIEYIAHQLARGRYYRGKTLDQKLRMYNPNPRYAAEVRKLMGEIEADQYNFRDDIVPTSRNRAPSPMKSLGGSGESVRHGAAAFAEELRYAICLPEATTIIGIGSLDVLHPNLTIAANFRPFNAQEMFAVRARSKKSPDDGRFELYKTSVKYGGVGWE
jgi:hypothetical protein